MSSKMAGLEHIAGSITISQNARNHY
jgi:hypothetical protein